MDYFYVCTPINRGLMDYPSSALEKRDRQDTEEQRARRKNNMWLVISLSWLTHSSHTHLIPYTLYSISSVHCRDSQESSTGVTTRLSSIDQTTEFEKQRQRDRRIKMAITDMRKAQVKGSTFDQARSEEIRMDP